MVVDGFGVTLLDRDPQVVEKAQVGLYHLNNQWVS
jgi:hypothetical protein